MRVVCIHQPDFLPYLGFFQRLLSSDLFVYLDDAQFLRKGSGWHNRDRIKTAAGETWLTLPVKAGHLHRRICEVALSEAGHWRRKHLNVLRENYRKAPFFPEYFPAIEALYLADAALMVEFNVRLLRFFYEILDLRVNEVFSSALGVPGQSNQKLINLIRAVGGTHYLSGSGARAYLDEKMFAAAGITVLWQRFEQPVYPQLHGAFIPYLSCIDALFNCGPAIKDLVRSCGAAT